MKDMTCRGEEMTPTRRPLAFDLNDARYGSCMDANGARRRMNHAIAHEDIARSFRPVSVPPLVLAVPFLGEFPSVSFGSTNQLPSGVALIITSFLGNVDDLDALSATSVGLRAVARSHIPEEGLLRCWISSETFQKRLRLYCPRSLCRTFSSIDRVANTHGWDAVLWQAAALGCVHGIWLALDHGGSIDDYSGGRDRKEGPALWVAAKMNHLPAVRVLCEDGGADIERRGGILTRSTPLWVAAREGNASIVRYLLARGADTTSRSRNGNGSSVRAIVLRALQLGQGNPSELYEILDWV